MGEEMVGKSNLLDKKMEERGRPLFFHFRPAICQPLLRCSASKQQWYIIVYEQFKVSISKSTMHVPVSWSDPKSSVLYLSLPILSPLQVFPHQWKPPSPKVPSCLARSLMLRTSVDKGGEEGDSGVKYKKTQEPCIPSTHLTKSSTFSSFLRSASCSKMCMFCNNQCVYS